LDTTNENLEAMNYIATTYLTTAVDSQRNTTKLIDDDKYIINWYVSIVKNGLNGIILHDGLSQEFMDRYNKVDFLQVDPIPEGAQLYDYRWAAYLKCFEKYEIDNIFFTDVSDVTVQKNPFTDPFYQKDKLYCGDVQTYHSTLGEEPWIAISLLNKDLIKLPGFVKTMKSNKLILNCGTFGGSMPLIYTFLKIMNLYMTFVKFRPLDIVGDITLFNYIMYRYFSKQFYCGYPVNSVFRKYEKRNDVWFIHK
jgi:hypothetical protein